jgi:hypothetical protein
MAEDASATSSVPTSELRNPLDAERSQRERSERATVTAILFYQGFAVSTHTMGGLSIVVGALSIVGIPAAILFGLIIDETQGMSLETASKEAEIVASEH